jgi:hypothetical protein
MNKKEALKKYPSYKKIIEKYKNADKYVWLNTNDKDLHPIRITLPEPPDWSKINGFGKEASEQVFERESYPNKLKILENTLIQKSKDNNTLKSPSAREKWVHKEIYKQLLSSRGKYKEEIEWIRRQWQLREYGNWYFINGKPTYLTGWQFVYCNYWKIEGLTDNDGVPEYRDKDRRRFAGIHYAYTCKEVPVVKKINKRGDPTYEYNDDGSLKMEDVGYRVFAGVNILKGRREGCSNIGQCIEACLITEARERHGGLTANRDGTASSIYRRIFLVGYKNFPFFFRPQMSSVGLMSGINFDSGEPDSLKSYIDYSTTALKHGYDGTKLYYAQGDEVGKLLTEDVCALHEVMKECLSPGGNISGLITYVSTVDEMTADSAKNFKKLVEKSRFEKRNENGQTQTLLFNIFIPSYDGMEGYIGRYGESIIDYAEPDQVPYMNKVAKDYNGRVLGARKYMERERDSLIKNKDHFTLIERKRKFPFSFKECFEPPAQNVYFNIEKLSNRLEELRFKPQTKRVDFEWENGFGSKVVMVDNEESGLWNVSLTLPNTLTNRKISINGEFYPDLTFGNKFIAAADPFRFDKTDSNRESKGSTCIRWLRDYTLDPEEKDVKDIISDKTVATYLNKPDTNNDFAEDALKACIYFGSLMYPENNINLIQPKFIDWGYGGYLHYDVNIETGQQKNNSGYSVAGQSGTIKNTMFDLAKTDINLNIHKFDHPDIIEQMLAITSKEKLRDYDMLSAYLGSLLGKNSVIYLTRMGEVQGTNKIDVSNFFNNW